MYHQVAARLAVLGDQTAEVSQPVSMEGANAARFEFTIHSIDPTPDVVTVTLQGSSDRENWESLSSHTGNAVGHFKSALETDVAAAFVRLEYKITTSDAGKNAVLSAGIHTMSN